MPKLTVDGIEVEVPAGATVLQACEAAGKEILQFSREGLRAFLGEAAYRISIDTALKRGREAA
jgi:Flp pilus assembly protein TadB